MQTEIIMSLGLIIWELAVEMVCISKETTKKAKNGLDWYAVEVSQIPFLQHVLQVIVLYLQ